MNFATLDLASKFSAACIRNTKGEVLREFDSAGKSSFVFAAEFARACIEFDVQLIVIEDVPYGISSQAMVKPVLRLQGILIAMLHKQLAKVVFLNPSTWQKEFPGVATAPKGTPTSQKQAVRAEAARLHALEAGYTPPDLVGEYVAQCAADGTKVLKKHTAPLEKIMTDYIDAFLMSQWVLMQRDLAAVHGIKGAQPVMI